MRLLILLALLCTPALAEDVEIELEEVTTAESIALCAASLLILEDPENALWFTIVVEDVQVVNYYVNLFRVAIDTGKMSIEEVEAGARECLDVKKIYDEAQAE